MDEDGDDDDHTHVDGSNVVLTGFMGTGKTSVGRLLAGRLGYDFVDTDELIEGRNGPIGEIIATRGEAAFRALEREVAIELGRGREMVIATGGGLMTDPGARAALMATGRVFCLVADVDEIHRRVDRDGVHRPLLGTGDRRAVIERLLDERAELYATFTRIDTTTRSPDDVAAFIAEELAATGNR